MPIVSVLMAAHDAERWLRPAMDSILSQSLRDIEIIVVDDGSTDGTSTMLTAYAAIDPRLQVIRVAENHGLAQSLNVGLAACRAPLVARMDADDIAHSNRLEQQIAYLAGHPEVGIVGGQAVVIDATDRRCGILSMPQEPMAVRWRSILSNPFIHSTVMFRRALLQDGQPAFAPMLRSAQDYELWCRLLAATHGANLPVPLISYRVIDNGITGRRRPEQLANHTAISNRQARQILAESSPGTDDLEFLRATFVWRKSESSNPAERARAIRLLFQMAECFFRREDLSRSDRGAIWHDTVITVLNALRAERASLALLSMLGRYAPLFPIDAARAWVHRRKMLAQ